jgi:hypothetical protein
MHAVTGRDRSRSLSATGALRMPEKKGQAIYVRCDRDLEEQMRKLARKEDRSFSAMVRVAMRECIAKRMPLLTDERTTVEEPDQCRY